MWASSLIIPCRPWFTDKSTEKHCEKGRNKVGYDGHFDWMIIIKMCRFIP